MVRETIGDTEALANLALRLFMRSATFLVILSDLFWFLGAICGALVALATLPIARLKRYTWLRRLLDRWLLIAGLGILSVGSGYGLHSYREFLATKEPFAPVSGPGVSFDQNATDQAFEFELRHALEEQASKARAYFYAAGQSFDAKNYRLAADEYAKSIQATPTLAAYLNEGLSLRWLNERVAAEQIIRQGLDLARKMGDQTYEGQFLYNLGILFVLKQDKQAEATLHRALALSIVTKNRLGQAACEVALAIYLYDEGQVQQALGYFHTAANIYKKLDNHLGEATVMTDLANYDIDQLYYNEARTKLEDALELYRELQNPQGELSALGILGSICYEEADYDGAAKNYLDAMAIADKFQLRRDAALLRIHLTSALAARGEPEAALRYADEAAKLVAKGRDPILAIDEIKARGLVHKEMRDFDTAVRELNEALEKYTAAGVPLGQVDASVALGESYLNQKMAIDATTVCKRALPVAESSGNLKAKVRVLSCVGRAALEIGNLADAKTALEEADTIYRSRNLKGREVDAVRSALNDLKNRERVHQRIEQPRRPKH